MKSLKTIQILRDKNHQTVNADIVRLTRENAKQEIDRLWWTFSGLIDSECQKESDRHWIWSELVDSYTNNYLAECVGVLSSDYSNYIDGAMIYRFNSESQLETGKYSLYIERLATAPRNRKKLINKSFYKGIGTVLLYWAVQESYNYGLGGRINLESLPTPNTLSFYKNRGFERTDLSQSELGLVDFELPENAALKWLREKGDVK